MTDIMTKVYPDSPEGVQAFLTDFTTISVYDMEHSMVASDPEVSGVWQVLFPDKSHAIIYLAGYPDPYGNVRSENDFEYADAQ